MEWCPLDTSPRNFRTQRELLRQQRYYLERAVGCVVSQWLLKKLHADIRVRGLEYFTEHAAAHAGRRVLLIPNHRSYLDPLVLHHVLTMAGHRQPRVAALDFLAATPLAPMLKRCGAVFIRGSFANLDYRERMNEQLRALLDAGEWLEFYLEGQRSISGKQLDPRRGLLAALTADQPCIIYPVNLSYERLIEDREFIRKRQGFDVKHAVQSLLAPGKGIGQIHVSFGAPLLTEPGVHVPELARSLTSAIMRDNVVYGSDLLAAVLLDRQEAVTATDVEGAMRWLEGVLQARGVTVGAWQLEDVLKRMRHAVTVKRRGKIRQCGEGARPPAARDAAFARLASSRPSPARSPPATAGECSSCQAGAPHPEPPEPTDAAPLDCTITTATTLTIRDKTLLIYYRNRMLYTITDLVVLPETLRKEALWTPERPVSADDGRRVRAFAQRALEPTVFLYKYLLDQLHEGVVSRRALQRSIEDNPHACPETVLNLLTVLKEEGLVRWDGDTVHFVEGA